MIFALHGIYHGRAAGRGAGPNKDLPVASRNKLHHIEYMREQLSPVSEDVRVKPKPGTKRKQEMAHQAVQAASRGRLETWLRTAKAKSKEPDPDEGLTYIVQWI